MLFCLFVLALVVMMGGLVVMVGSGLVMSGGLLMVLARGLLGQLRSPWTIC